MASRLLSWLRRRARAIRHRWRWQVRLEAGRIVAVHPEGDQCSVALAGLHAVVIETNDTGPFGDDCWWQLYQDAGGAPACAFPQSAIGQQDVVNALMALPGFDPMTMLLAMGSTENARFPVWTRPQGQPPADTAAPG